MIPKQAAIPLMWAVFVAGLLGGSACQTAILPAHTAAGSQARTLSMVTALPDPTPMPAIPTVRTDARPVPASSTPTASPLVEAGRQPVDQPGPGEEWLLPDGEVVYGPKALDFSIGDYLAGTQGSLRAYREWLESSGWTSAAQVIERVALENSINPRLLLSLLEWECGCVQAEAPQALDSGYVLGVDDYHRKSLYGQLSWAARSLAEGFYGRRSGQYPPDLTASYLNEHLTPEINPGSAALLVYFTRLREYRLAGSDPISLAEWEQALDRQAGLPALYASMFGEPWEGARHTGANLPESLQQPILELPFEPGRKWSFSSGPHPAWENAGALSALDFAPATSQPGCFPSSAWVTAVAAGLVVRSEYGSVILDLDEPGGAASDGYEGSGWAILYMHIAAEGRITAGTRLRAGDRIGHPSCQGGPATGTHVHIARKYNGEWIAADSSLPFIMSGWTPHNGENSYQGSLTKDGQTVVSDFYGTARTLIHLPEDGSETP